MRIVDTEEGRILGVNFVDLVVLAVILFLAFSFGKTLLGSELVFDGDEVYKAVKAYSRLDSKGFIVEARIEGRYIGDPTRKLRSMRGVVVSARGGTLYLRNIHGEVYTVGGSMSYLEDVAAERIELLPVAESTLGMYSARTHFRSTGEMLDALEELRQAAGAGRLMLTGELLLASGNASLPVLKRELETCYYCTTLEVYRAGEGLYLISMKNVELSELSALRRHAGDVSAEELRIYLGYGRELSSGELEEAEKAAAELGFLRRGGETGYASIRRLL